MYDDFDQQEFFSRCYIVNAFQRIDATHYQCATHVAGSKEEMDKLVKELSAAGWAVRTSNPSTLTSTVPPHAWELRDGAYRRPKDKMLAGAP